MEREGGGVPIEESSAAEGSPNYTRAGPPAGMGVDACYRLGAGGGGLTGKGAKRQSGGGCGRGVSPSYTREFLHFGDSN